MDIAKINTKLLEGKYGFITRILVVLSLLIFIFIVSGRFLAEILAWFLIPVPKRNSEKHTKTKGSEK